MCLMVKRSYCNHPEVKWDMKYIFHLFYITAWDAFVKFVMSFFLFYIILFKKHFLMPH